jgi:hypothetical protein
VEARSTWGRIYECRFLPRDHIAALDASSGVATGWNPSANNDVKTLLLSGGLLYAGGLFTSVGQPRNHLAAFDPATGLTTAWNPNVDGPVYALAVNGNTGYLGGEFFHIGGQMRSRIGAVDAASGSVTAWDPIGNGFTVRALAPSGGLVYVGGAFWNIGGEYRVGLAALDATTGTATPWNPNPTGNMSNIDGGYPWPSIHAFAISGGTLYAVGSFWQPRSGLVAMPSSTVDALASERGVH